MENNRYPSRRRSLDRVKLETEFYSLQFETAHIDAERDRTWLTDLAGCEFDQRWLDTINKNIVGIGSVVLDEDHESLRDAIIAARKEFFEIILGWEDYHHPMYETYCRILEKSPDLFPINKVIEVARYADQTSIEPSVLLQRYPDILATDPKTLKLRVQRLAEKIPSLEAVDDSDIESVSLNADTDGEWFYLLTGRQLKEQEYEHLNRLVRIGSQRQLSGAAFLADKNRGRVDTIASARTEFFENVMGWADEKHPMHQTYQGLKTYSSSLIPLGRFIQVQRLFRRYGIDNRRLTKAHTATAILNPDIVRKRLGCVEGLGLDVKHSFETAYRQLLHAHPRMMTDTYRTLESLPHGDVQKMLCISPALLGYTPSRIMASYEEVVSTPGLDINTILNKQPGILAIDSVELSGRISHAISLGITPQALSKNPNLLVLRQENLKESLSILAAKGLDAVRIANKSFYAIGSSEALVDSRIESLTDMGLDAVRIINNRPGALNRKPELVREMISTVRDILKYCNINLKAEDVINQQPGFLSCAQKKLWAAVLILEDSVEPQYIATLNADKLWRFALCSIDSILMTVIAHKTSPPWSGGVTHNNIRYMDRRIRPQDRREHNLNNLSRHEIAESLGKRIPRVYLDYQPLTEKELANYPELKNLDS